MRATDIWGAGQGPTISFELFPARSEKAARNLDRAIDRLAALSPDFVSVTFGAGGSTREGSRQLIDRLKNEKHLEVIAYFAGYGLGPDQITEVLDGYRDMGVENILVVRGDPPHDAGDFAPHPDSLPHATDLLEFVRSRYDFCLGAAGYPEGHIDCESRDRDLEFLKLKVANGAEFIVANYFYDNQLFLDFVERCRGAGVEVPIVPGVMPVYSVKMMETLANLCGATITQGLRTGLAGLPEGDKDALVAFGVEFAVGQCRGLLAAGVPGLHIYTMDLSKSTVAIVKRLREEGLLPDSTS